MLLTKYGLYDIKEYLILDKVVWSDDYSTGVDAVDEQHKKLVEITARFYDALMGDEEDYLKQRVDLLKELVDYTVYHFNFEEKLFEEINYYSRDPHTLQHSMFVAQVEAQVNDLLQSDISKGKAFYEFLILWLLSHISKSDKLFCQKYLAVKAQV